MQIALVCAGGLGLYFALSIWLTTADKPRRVAAAALGVMSLAVAAMAIPPDLPQAHARSWQDLAHNTIYPLIPTSALVAAVILARGDHRGRVPVRARLSVAFLPVAVLALALTLIASIAQAARFVFFGALLMWVAFLAVDQLVGLQAQHGDSG